jgi:hypothetical protein
MRILTMKCIKTSPMQKNWLIFFIFHDFHHFKNIINIIIFYIEIFKTSHEFLDQLHV